MQFVPAGADASFDANPVKWWEEVRRDVAEPRPGRRLTVHLKLSNTPTIVGAAREKKEAESKKESALNRLAQKIAEQPNEEPAIAPAALATALPVVAGDAKSAAAGGGSGGVLSLASTQPRYTLTVIDAKGKRSNGQYSCGVLLVPQGREHEWVLNSPAGQAQLASDAGFGRLCFVTLNRGHAFASLDAVKAELAIYMRELAPERNSAQIPYLTVDKQSSSGIGQRTIVAALDTKHNGETVVEDITIPADKVNGAYALRRLVFLSSRLIQSEARIRTGALPAAGAGGASASAAASAAASARLQKKREKAKLKKAAGGAVIAKEKEPATAAAAAPTGKAAADAKDAKSATPAPAAVSTAVAASPKPGSDVRIDYGWLSCSYYRGMVAGLAVANKIESVLLLGLGGGSMTMFLHEFFPNFKIHAVELDPEVVALAQTYFGFKTSPRLTVEVADGMAVVNQLHASIQAARDKYRGVPVPGQADAKAAAPPADAAATAAAAAAATAANAKSNAPAAGGGGSAKDKRKKKAANEAKREQSVLESKRAAAAIALAASTPAAEHPEIEKLKRDLIIIDINAQDFSTGLSFPPAPFVSTSFLATVKACVPVHGMVMWNVGCRNADLRRQIYSDIASAFQEVYELIPDEEDVNRIIVAVPYQRIPQLTTATLLQRLVKPGPNTFVPASASTAAAAPAPGDAAAAAAAAPATATAADGSSFDPTRHLYSFHPEMNLTRLAKGMHVITTERSTTIVAEPKLSVSSLPAA